MLKGDENLGRSMTSLRTRKSAGGADRGQSVGGEGQAQAQTPWLLLR